MLVVSDLFCWFVARRSKGANMYSRGNRSGQVISSASEKHILLRFPFFSHLLSNPLICNFLTILNDMAGCERPSVTPVIFPDSALHPIIHLQVSHGCFLSYATPPYVSLLILEIAFSRFFPHSLLPVPLFIEILAEARREIRLWNRREWEKHDIRSAGTHIFPPGRRPGFE